MPAIRIVDAKEVVWYDKDNFPYEIDTEIVGQSAFHHPGSPTEMQLFEVDFPPDHELETHAHGADEIIYVLEGSMVLGARELTAGSSVFIPGRTLYNLKAGPNGLRFINFRATQDLIYLKAEQFMAQRGATPDAASITD